MMKGQKSRSGNQRAVTQSLYNGNEEPSRPEIDLKKSLENTFCDHRRYKDFFKIRVRRGSNFDEGPKNCSETQCALTQSPVK